MRIRPSLSLAAVAVGSILYSVYVIAGSVETSTSSPCPPPTLAVDFYVAGLGPTLIGLNDTGTFKEETCEDTCKKIRGTCRGIAKTAKSCFNSAVSKAAGVQEEACGNILDDGDRSTCKDDVSADLANLKNFSSIDGKDARECCDDLLEGCILTCLTGNLELLPFCTVDITDPSCP